MATANRTPVLFPFTVISARPGDWSPAALMVNHVTAYHSAEAACAALRAHAQAAGGFAADYQIISVFRGHYTDLAPALYPNWKAPLYEEALSEPGGEVADEW